MKLGKVVGSVWATQKEKTLEGHKLMIVQTLNPSRDDGLKHAVSGDRFLVAVDLVGAGVGETVLFCSGSSARAALESKDSPIDAAIVGIIDKVDINAAEVC